MSRGKSHVIVWRENLLGSRCWNMLPGTVKSAYLLSLIMLTNTKDECPIRGCLVCGNAPMTFAEWQKEVGIRKSEPALKIWETLLDPDCGLFEKVVITGHIGQGREYVRCANFDKNQDRYKANNRGDSRGVEKSNGPGTDRERTGNGPGTDRERTGNGQPVIETKGVMTQKSEKRLYTINDNDTLDRLSADNRSDLTQSAQTVYTENVKSLSGDGSVSRSESDRQFTKPRKENRINAKPEHIGAVLENITTSIEQLHTQDAYTAHVEHLPEMCNAHERQRTARTLENWTLRVNALMVHPGGIEFLRERLRHIELSKDPRRDDVGVINTPAPWLNKETSNWLKQAKEKKHARNS